VNRSSARQPSGALVILLLVNILNFYDRQVLGAVVEPVRREFGLSDTQIGALSTVFTLVYAVAGLPLGWLADTSSRRRLLAAGVALWSALTATAALASSYPLLLVSRLGVAIGEAVCAPAATSWIGDLYGPERRSRALAVFMLGVPVGTALSAAVSGPSAQAFGWRSAFTLAAVPGLLLVPALLMLREPPRTRAKANTSAEGIRTLLRMSTLWWITISGALVNFSLYALSSFLPAFLTRVHSLSVARAGIWVGIGSGVAGVLGGIAAGRVGDLAFRRRPDGRMIAATSTAACAAPVFYFGISQPAGQAGLAAVLIMAGYGLLNTYYGLVYSTIQDVVPPGLRGTAMALYFVVMYLCGASFGPLLTGRLSDALARTAAGTGPLTETARAIGLHQAMLVIPALSLALAFVLWGGARSVEADMRRVSGC